MSTTATRQSQRDRAVSRVSNSTKNWDDAQHPKPRICSIDVCACPDKDCDPVEEEHEFCWICEGAGCSLTKAQCDG